MMQRIHLNDIFSDFVNSGIFTYINNYDVPWKNDNITVSLNLAYHGEHSGDKNISPLVSKLLGSDGKLSSDNKNKIAKMIYDKYNMQWQHIYDALITEYNPIENYRMTEEEKTDIDLTHTGTDTVTNTGTIETENSGTNENNIYGFNSSSAVNSDKSSDSAKSKTTNNLTNTNTKNLTDVTDGTRKLTRSGNIGVTTSQQMQQSSIDLWQYNYFDSVFKNIDAELCLLIY